MTASTATHPATTDRWGNPLVGLLIDANGRQVNVGVVNGKGPSQPVLFVDPLLSNHARPVVSLVFTEVDNADELIDSLIAARNDLARLTGKSTRRDAKRGGRG